MTQGPTGPNTLYRGPNGSSPARRPRVRRASRALGPQLVELGLLLLLMVIAYNGVIWYWNRTSPKEVTVPKVSALREDEASTVLTTAGLKAEVVARKYNEKIAEGVITGVDPEPGRRVKAGRVVRLTVSLGSRWSKVPDVQKMSVDRARALIKEAKLVVGQESAAQSDTIPIGYVILQNPPPGRKVVRNSSVNLQLSRGPEAKSDEETESPATPDQGQHSYDVEFVVPPGASLQDVRIVVSDSTGEHEVYHHSHQVGDVVRKHVTGQGDNATVQIYTSGYLAEEHDF